MGKIVRCLSDDGSVLVMAIDAKDIVGKAVDIHQTSAVATVAMGKLISAASMMGYLLKEKSDTITLRVNGDGPLSPLIAVSDYEGNVRACPAESNVELPLTPDGKLDSGAAVGKNGILYVIRDMGLKEPYVGSTPIINGEIAEEITSYYAMSEQVPTVCSLGVAVNPDLSVKSAGGYIIQLLPFASEEVICKVEKSIEDVPPVSEMLSSGMSCEDICRRVLKEFDIDILDSREPQYKCNCSRERVERALISMGKKELIKLAEEDKKAEVNCQFCGNSYAFTEDDLMNLLK